VSPWSYGTSLHFYTTASGDCVTKRPPGKRVNTGGQVDGPHAVTIHNTPGVGMAILSAFGNFMMRRHSQRFFR
jgi:hypothetical protein